MMFKFIFIFIISLIYSISGCTTQPAKAPASSAEVLIDNKLNFSLLNPPVSDKSYSLTQAVSIQYNNQQHNFIAQLETENKSFKMVGLNSIGVMLFSIDSDINHYIFNASPLLPDSMNLKYLLADLQLTYWPVDDLNTQLSKSNAIVSKTALKRTLSKDGTSIISIEYSKPHQWNTNVVFKHLKRNYTVSITLLGIESL